MSTRFESTRLQVFILSGMKEAPMLIRRLASGSGGLNVGRGEGGGGVVVLSRGGWKAEVKALTPYIVSPQCS